MKHLLPYVFLISILSLLKVILAAEKEKDLYKTLGISRDATANEIKHKYRQLSRKYHPDKNKSPEAHSKYVDINEAYEILSDNKKRRLYDRGGMEAVKQSGQMDQQGGDPFDIFGSFFGGGGRRQRDNRDEDIRIKVRCTLKDLYLGKEFEFVYTRNTICPHCRGSGAESRDDVATCDRCQGQGVIIERKQIGPGFIQQFQTTCPKCGGKGKMISKKCHLCSGEKIVKGLEDLTLLIEKGMPNGAEIKFDEFGEERADKDPGSLIFVVQELTHPLFKREGNNLRYSLEITLKEALIGFEREVEHFDGHKVTIKKEDVSQHGEVIKIRNEGMPVHQKGDFGDMLVELKIKFPDKLKEEQRVKLSVLFNRRSGW